MSRKLSRLTHAYLDMPTLEQIRGLITEADQLLKDQASGMGNVPELQSAEQELEEALKQVNFVIYSL